MTHKQDSLDGYFWHSAPLSPENVIGVHIVAPEWDREHRIASDSREKE